MRTFVKFIVLVALVLTVLFGWLFYFLAYWPEIAFMTAGAIIWFIIERIAARVRKIKANSRERKKSRPQQDTT